MKIDGTVKERPILFNGEMVRSILEGRKTQTRRIVKPQPKPNFLGDPIRTMHRLETGEWAAFDDCGMADNGSIWRCPYGQPGDRLWVKETHREYCHVWSANAHSSAIQYRADMTGFTGAGTFIPEPNNAYGKWTPSIFMTRWASRITLEITSVRVERLNDISEADAKSEGVSEKQPFLWRKDEWQNMRPFAARYASLWEWINGAGSWDLNPWVWVIEFKHL